MDDEEAALGSDLDLDLGDDGADGGVALELIQHMSVEAQTSLSHPQRLQVKYCDLERMHSTSIEPQESRGFRQPCPPLFPELLNCLACSRPSSNCCVGCSGGSAPGSVLLGGRRPQGWLRGLSNSRGCSLGPSVWRHPQTLAVSSLEQCRAARGHAQQAVGSVARLFQGDGSHLSQAVEPVRALGSLPALRPPRLGLPAHCAGAEG